MAVVPPFASGLVGVVLLPVIIAARCVHGGHLGFVLSTVTHVTPKNIQELRNEGVKQKQGRKSQHIATMPINANQMNQLASFGILTSSKIV